MIDLLVAYYAMGWANCGIVYWALYPTNIRISAAPRAVLLWPRFLASVLTRVIDERAKKSRNKQYLWRKQ